LTDERGAAPTISPSFSNIWPGDNSFTLDDHQAQAIDAIKRRSRGVVFQAVGAGKSVEIASAIHALGVPSLVVVSRKELLRQQIERLEQSGCRSGCWGIAGDGYWRPQMVTVATIQTLSRRLKSLATHAETSALLARFQAVHIDECHHLPASGYRLLMYALPNAYYRVGYSATPHRSDDPETKLNVTGMTGPVISYLTPSEGIEAGRLVGANIYMVEAPGKDPDEIDGYFEWYDRDGRKQRRPKYNYQKAITTGIVHNTERNKAIAQLADRLGKKGPTIVLADRVEHAQILRELMLDAGHQEVR